MNRATLIRLALLATLIGFIAVAAQYRDALDVELLSAQLDRLGGWAPAAFIALYAVATVAFVPGSILTLAGGAMFGPVLGTLYNLTGATLGAVLAFLAARYVASNWVRGKAGPKLDRIIRGVEDEDWRFVAFTRLVPLFPFNLLNYALGLTRISLGHYTLATAVCMIPGALAYTYLGHAGREAATGNETAIQSGLIALALLAVVMFLPRLIKKIRGAKFRITTKDLKARLDEADDILVLDVRTANDFSGDGGHIPGARNVPVEDLGGRFAELEDWRDRPLAVLCRTNKKSAKAVEHLRAQGFTNVLLVDDGMAGWSRNGFSTALETETV
jgi:uncharacterized membrane protein YdjX (TVP38/TMEM64 family)/rhodanese-related sulfurtransferase